MIPVQGGKCSLRTQHEEVRWHAVIVHSVIFLTVQSPTMLLPHKHLLYRPEIGSIRRRAVQATDWDSPHASEPPSGAHSILGILKQAHTQPKRLPQ